MTNSAPNPHVIPDPSANAATRRPNRIRLAPAVLGAISVILIMPVILWLIGYGLLPLYAWGLSWLR